MTPPLKVRNRQECICNRFPDAGVTFFHDPTVYLLYIDIAIYICTIYINCVYVYTLSHPIPSLPTPHLHRGGGLRFELTADEQGMRAVILGVMEKLEDEYRTALDLHIDAETNLKLNCTLSRARMGDVMEIAIEKVLL